MKTKNSQKKQAKSGSEEAQSRMLSLVSGQKGPLPLENEQKMKLPKTAGITSSGTPSKAQGKNSGQFSQGQKGQLMEMYPALTEQELDEYLAET